MKKNISNCQTAWDFHKLAISQITPILITDNFILFRVLEPDLEEELDFEAIRRTTLAIV